ncbi:MAG TPA: tetratricopeptide repeat protein, partial [Terriglobia bacterium]|nr:tetratricopeptide repeat protein [Terriglobia bacterium]
MRLKSILAILALMTVFVAAFTAAPQNPGAALLEQARAKKAAGDLQGAAEGFEKLLTDFAAERKPAANALLELGAIAESLDQKTRARNYYERLRREYSDQGAEVTAATNRLAELEGRSAPGNAAAGVGGGATGVGRIVIKTPYTEDPYAFALSPD